MDCQYYLIPKRGWCLSKLKNLFSAAIAFIVMCGLVTANALIVHGQSAISPNGLDTEVIPDGTQYFIKGGTITEKGHNQFHSFERFSVGAGDTARFDGPSRINNILARVTGGVRSDINGTLSSNIEGANLFLLNPSGVVFGPDAKLDLSGSFHVSTADYVKFDDGSVFSARGGQVPGNILDTASPEAFGFLGDTTPGTIAFKGGDNWLGLVLPDGKTFAVVGGDVTLDKSVIRGEHILIASSKSAGEVTFKNDTLDMGSTIGRGMIKLTNASRLDTDGQPGRHVVIHGGQLVLEAGELRQSEISAEAYDEEALGQGIEIDVDKLSLLQGSFISTETSGKGNAGHINIKTNSIVFDRGKIKAGSWHSDAFGHGGDITIIGKDSLTIKAKENSYGNTISTSNRGKGAPGNITVESPQSNLTIDDVYIESNTENNHSGGTIKISADTIIIQNNSELNSFNAGVGDGGYISVTADNTITMKYSSIINGTGDFFDQEIITKGEGGDILIDAGYLITLQGSYIGGETFNNSGTAGNIKIISKKLTINDSSLLDVGSFGTGDAGVITISVDNLDLHSSGIGSPASSEWFPLPDIDPEFSLKSTGDAGSVTIQGHGGKGTSVTNMSLTDSQIVTTAALGEGGAISIDADAITVTESKIVSSVIGGEKDAGNIIINASELTISGENSQISSETQGAGNAGSVTLNVGTLNLDNGVISSRSTETAAGNAGAIVIQGQTGAGSFADSVTLNDGNVLTTIENEKGGDNSQLGDIMISSNELDFSASQISSSTAGYGGAGNITLLAGRLNAKNSKITSRSTGQGAAGSIVTGTYEAPIHELELGNTEISVHAVDGPQPGQSREGNISIYADGSVSIDDGSIITASVDNGLGGDISIQKPHLLVVKDASKILAQTENGTGGRIEIGADLFVKSAYSLISADAGVGTSGDVFIDVPTIDLQSSLAALSAELLNVSALIKQGCAARAANDVSSFTVSHRKGMPLSPEGLIQTFDLASAGWIKLPHETIASDEDQAITVARNEMAEGAMAFRGGNMGAASRNYSRASMLFGKIGDTEARSDALLDLGQAQMIAGEHTKAIQNLRDALTLAERSGDSGRMAAALNKLGNIHLTFGDTNGAEEFLSQGVSRAKAAGRQDLEIVIQNNLGNLLASKSSFEEAIDKYLVSARLAKSRGELLHEVKALANASRAALESGDFKRAMEYAKHAFEWTKGVSDNYEKTYLLIHIGNSFSKLAKLSSKQRNASLLDGYTALTVAVGLAKASRDGRLHSYALGNLGDLYRTENRFEEALFLVRKALQLAGSANAPELIYRWHWLEGQLLWAQGRTSPAIDAYYRAVRVLEETRQEALSQYGSGEVYFRNAVAPVYFDLIDALLQASDKVADENDAKALWEETRDTMEMMKGAELRNYFKDECIAELETKAESLENLVDQHEDVAVVYPILLADRMELLIKTPSDLKRYTIPGLGRAKVRTTVQRLYETISKKGNEYKKPCQDLYDWLVRPYVNDLDEKINTIVFVPCGILRTIPIAALHDGHQFLVEKFALAIAPSLKLIEPKPLDRTNPNPLLAGISEAITFPVGTGEPIERHMALIHVPLELKEISKLFGGDTLLNADFNLDRFAAALKEMTPSIVHIASHAEFSRDFKESFILAYDQKIYIDKLAEVVGLAKFREDPIELLMLSACETAMGDERAALGLAGIAIKAGARSAVGSLWGITDEAACELVVNFYKNLKDNPDCSKAEALRLAQKVLLKSKDIKLSHPMNWSPFILINNWL